MAQIALRNCLFYVQDGTPTTPNKIALKIGEGNLTYDEKRQMIYVRDRGILSGVRQGEDEPLDVKFDFIWEFLISQAGDVSTTIPSLEEALKKTGAAASWATTGADACEPYAVDILIKNIVTCGTVYNEWITLKEFRWESLNHDPKAGQVSATGKCKIVSPTILRTLST